MIDRKPIFQAVKQLRNGQGWTPAEVRLLDAAIDAAIGPVAATAPTAQIAKQVPLPTPAAPKLNKWQSMIDVPLLKLAFPANNNAELASWVEPTRAACARWGIDTLREIASFLANINVESAGLTRLSENLNYSTEALLKLFGRHRISVADAKAYGRNASHAANQEQLANILYGGTFGKKNLGNTQPGDGWKFRGYGPKQLTGRANQGAFAKAVGISIEDVPAYLRTKVGGMMSAGWFWHSHGLDAKAATPGVEDDRRAINGGTFGLAQVAETFSDLVEEMLRREKLL